MISVLTWSLSSWAVACALAAPWCWGLCKAAQVADRIADKRGGS